MSFIVTDKEGGQWLPAYTAFNKVMGKNALVIPFSFIFVDNEWYEVGELDVAREAYPIQPADYQDIVNNPRQLPEEQMELEEV